MTQSVPYARYSPSRKMAILREIDSVRTERDKRRILGLHSLSQEEVDGWRQAIGRHGWRGLQGSTYRRMERAACGTDEAGSFKKGLAS